MKKIWFVFLTYFSLSCSKNKIHCYECDFSTIDHPNSSPGTYQHAGCMTKDEWETIIFTDPLGSKILDKEKYCRKNR